MGRSISSVPFWFRPERIFGMPTFIDRGHRAGGLETSSMTSRCGSKL